MERLGGLSRQGYRISPERYSRLYPAEALDPARTDPVRSAFRSPAFWLRRMLPPVLMMAFIFWLGTDRGSARQTQTLLDWILTHCWPSLYQTLSADTLGFLNFAARKLGHFTGYAILGLLNARAVEGAGGPLAYREAGLAWTAAVGWAAVDEYHQSFSPSRGASVDDVVLDACGAAAGVLGFLLWTRRTTPNR